MEMPGVSAGESDLAGLDDDESRRTRMYAIDPL
jgi:hypothetical protein